MIQARIEVTSNGTTATIHAHVSTTDEPHRPATSEQPAMGAARMIAPSRSGSEAPKSDKDIKDDDKPDVKPKINAGKGPKHVTDSGSHGTILRSIETQEMLEAPDCEMAEAPSHDSVSKASGEAMQSHPYWSIILHRATPGHSQGLQEGLVEHGRASPTTATQTRSGCDAPVQDHDDEV